MPDINLHPDIKKRLLQGVVIPAHPLALTIDRILDEYHQRLLTRYYIACGAGGIAVGVHTTQFEIRHPEINLLKPVLKLAAEEIDHSTVRESFIKVAGICGSIVQAKEEALLAKEYGYHLGLLSNGGLNSLSEKQLIERAEKIAEVIPVFGFYLQPAVGGRILSYDYWKDFVAIPNVHAIKIAAFNRYQTLDVIRAVCASERKDGIALYTGNDDNIIADLLTPYRFNINGQLLEKYMVGGLLGHWAVWTRSAVDIFNEIKNAINKKEFDTIENFLCKGISITDMNAAIFDPSNNFNGCIPGINEILSRQKLLKGRWCLNPEEDLSQGQMEEIDRVSAAYPELIDDDFVNKFLDADRLRFHPNSGPEVIN